MLALPNNAMKLSSAAELNGAALAAYRDWLGRNRDARPNREGLSMRLPKTHPVAAGLRGNL